MGSTREHLLPQALRTLLTQATDVQLRTIAIESAATAVHHAVPGREVFDRAITALRAGAVDSSLRELVTAAAEGLDDEYLNVHDAEESGRHSSACEAMFRAARAAAALTFALDQNRPSSAVDAVYEALYALGEDDEVLLDAIRPRASRPGDIAAR